MCMHADVTTYSSTSKDFGSSISHIQIDVAQLNNNTVYYLANQYTQEQNAAERLVNKYYNNPESLTQAERNALSDANIKNLQKTLVNEFVNGEYDKDSTLKRFVSAINARN